jgi:hypothetical protein
MGNPEQSALPEAGEDLFGRYGCAVTLACAAVLMCGIAAIDKLTGYDLQLGILHLIPIAIATWAGGRAWGLAFSVMAIVLWLAIFRAAHHYTTTLYYYWDAVVLFGTFVLFTLLMARLHEELRASDSRFGNVLESWMPRRTWWTRSAARCSTAISASATRWQRRPTRRSGSIGQRKARCHGPTDGGWCCAFFLKTRTSSPASATAVKAAPA